MLTAAFAVAGCSIPDEPTAVLNRYASHKVEFNALAAEILACRPEKRPANGEVQGPWIRTEKDSAPIVCLQPGQSADRIKPMMRALRIKAMAADAETGVFSISFNMERAGLAISGASRDLVYVVRGKPTDPGEDGELIAADPSDPHWYVLTSWT